MRILPPFVTALCLAASPLAATSLICIGTNPNWRIEIQDTAATFQYRDRVGDFTIPHDTAAQNDPATHAYTLIGDTVTAILITTPATCNTDKIAAHVLTQDRSEAILLTGCCVAETP